MTDPTFDELVDAVESQYGITLPDDYVSFLPNAHDPISLQGDGFVNLWDVNRVLNDNRDLPQRGSHPGLMVVGTDGSRELIGFDFRKTPPPVVLADISSAGWSDAFFQADSFSTFLDRLKASGFRWNLAIGSQGGWHVCVGRLCRWL